MIEHEALCKVPYDARLPFDVDGVNKLLKVGGMVVIVNEKQSLRRYNGAFRVILWQVQCFLLIGLKI
ncbi:MAG: hypothetical protein B6I30_10515 [Desulfobacteraceae bacterium 4572_187]|nr:MAG: hypothetical protein B6I30_10515 [Desulfobacteraceae bacterium 4572_187]